MWHTPYSVTAHLSWTHEMRRAGWSIRTLTETTFTATQRHLVIKAHLRAWDGETEVFEHSWDEKSPGILCRRAVAPQPQYVI